MARPIKILCTLGPSSFNQAVVTRLDDLGVDVFRINLSHTRLEDLEQQIRTLQGWTRKAICLDTEGAQVRTSYMDGGRICLEENSIVTIADASQLGSAESFSLNPVFAADALRPGDLVSVDFNSVLLLVLSTSPVRAKVVSGGFVGSNKAVTVDRHINLPVVSAKDEAAIAMGRDFGLTHFALSFANTGRCVSHFRSLVGADAFLISKVESSSGLRHLPDILSGSNAILIDRGDLSREEPIETIPFLQKRIIRDANAAHVPVYVATNLLESMITAKRPTRAEAGDVVNTLLDGADGLVLAAETAIGEYPVNCVVMISKLIEQFHRYTDASRPVSGGDAGSLLLVAPHGGQLVDEWVRDVDSTTVQPDMPHVVVDQRVLMDVEQIAVGTFSPLRGFMTREEIDSVLQDYRLPGGDIWPLPIMWQVPADRATALAAGTTVVLRSAVDDQPSALVEVSSVFRYDLPALALAMFRTQDIAHPGVRELYARGEWFVSGAVRLLRRLSSALKSYEITPRQARSIFENRGWNRIVGFHTRNVVHLAHEYAQLAAMERSLCDGLFVHPVIGPKKDGDYEPATVMQSYELMLDRFYPKGKVLLAGFQSYSRYAGPREAVFTALCRKNFGCSHFVVGRDHTGVGTFYGPLDARRLFDDLGDIGIAPVYFDEVHYCRACGRHVESCDHGVSDVHAISGTEGRQMLRRGEAPPASFMRPEISAMILERLSRGDRVFTS